jgi:Ca-activated chloride channel family protein
MIILLALILAGAISLVSCGDNKPIVLKRNVVSVSIVHPPNMTTLMRQFKILFEESPAATLAEGSKVELNLISDSSMSAASKISSGKNKVHGWLAPSFSVVNLANSKRSNLGPQQINCAQLFATPIILATTAKKMNSMGLTTNEFSWRELFNLTDNENAVAALPIFNQTSPLASDSGLAAIIQLLYLATDFPMAIKREDLDVPATINKLRMAQSKVASYSFFDRTLLHQLTSARANKLEFSITTEQDIALFNQDRSKSGQENVLALYPKEGSVWLDYNLCMSDADWLTPAHKKALEQLIEYLKQPALQQMAVGAGLRPAAGAVPLTPPLTPQFTVDINKGAQAMLPVSGDVIERLTLLWPDLLKPSAIAFVLDTSGSMEGTSLRLGKTHFRNTIASTQPRDTKALISAASQVIVQKEFTNDGGVVIPALDQLRAQGGSSIYDAILKAITTIQNPSLDNYRRTIIVFTDGGDKNSNTPLSRLLELVRESTSRVSINLLIIGVGRDESFDDMRKIAEAANGLFVEAQYDDLDSIFQRILSII